MDNGKNNYLTGVSNFNTSIDNPSPPDVQFANKITNWKIKTKISYDALIHPHDYVETKVKNENAEPIDILCNIKYRNIEYENNTKDNFNAFKNRNFGVFLTEKDRQFAIKFIPEMALKSTHIQVPTTQDTTITKEERINNAKNHTNNDIMWIGLYKSAKVTGNNLTHALELAKKLHDEGKTQKVKLIIGFADKKDEITINTAIKFIQDIYKNFKPDTSKQEYKKDGKYRQLHDDLQKYIQDNNPAIEYNLEINLNRSEQETNEIAKTCQYLYKPEARGFSETSNALTNAVGRGMIVLTDTGYMTEKDYRKNGRFANAVVLGEKYPKGSSKEAKRLIRLTSDQAYNKIMEIENNPEQKQKLIEATYDLYNRRFNPEVVKRIWESHINSFDNKTFDNKKISQIHNSLDKNNCILSDAKKLNQKVAYIRDRNKYKQPNRQSFVVREKMIQVKNICFELMAELDLTITDVMRVFITAHSCGGLTNNKKAIQDLNYNVKDENKIKKMKEFSRLFQYYANQNDILSPNSSNKTKKQVGLRTKRVLDLFNGDVYALIEFLKENTTNIQLSK